MTAVNIRHLILALMLAAAPLARGAEFIQTNTYTLSELETLDADSWILATRITLAGEALDDVFLCAATDSLLGQDKQTGAISLSGRFQNDVWAVGNTIDLAGPVEGHARLAAKRISITGPIGRSAILLGNTVELTETSELKAGGLIVGEDLFAKGRVQGNLTLKGNRVTLSGTFGQNVYIAAPDIFVQPGTEIMGNLTYSSRSDLFLDDSVIVHGSTVKKAIPEKVPGWAPYSKSSVPVQCWLFLGALLAGSVFVVLFPAFTEQAVVKVRESVWTCMLTGMITVFIIPIVIFFAMVSVIGIPLGILLALAFMILTYLSKIIIAITIGALIIRRPWQRSFSRVFFPLLMGLVLLYAGVNSGLIGLAIWFVVTFAGIGGMLMALFTPRIPIAIPAQESYNVQHQETAQPSLSSKTTINKGE